jgi:hypothetical protein
MDFNIIFVSEGPAIRLSLVSLFTWILLLAYTAHAIYMQLDVVIYNLVLCAAKCQ